MTRAERRAAPFADFSHVWLAYNEELLAKGHYAVEDIDLKIGAGEFIAIVGPSGCGKSTLLRMVAGLEEISEGEISIAGRVVNNLEPSERDIAMVFQNYALYPHMTVYDNLAFGVLANFKPKARLS